MRALAIALCLMLWPALASATQFPCTEQGILDAIAAGGGPHTFACVGPTTVVTSAEIVIDNDVILDGEGNLIVDGNDDHRVLRVRTSVTAEMRGLTITRGDTAAVAIGAAISTGGNLTLTDVLVTGNSGDPLITVAVGGYGDLTLDHTVVSDNSGQMLIFVSDASLVITNSTIDGNVTDLGGIVVSAIPDPGPGPKVANAEALASATIVDSTISGNSAELEQQGVASAIHISGLAFVSIENSTISGNSGTSAGAAIACVDGGLLQIDNSTVASNLPDQILGCGQSVISNSAIAGNCVDGVMASAGGNVESPGDTCGFDDPTDQVNVPDQGLGGLNLGPLQDNGGPTDTHALLPGSVAIDAAVDCPPPDFDQRGVERPQLNWCDSGAVEFVPEPSLALLQVIGAASGGRSQEASAIEHLVGRAGAKSAGRDWRGRRISHVPVVHRQIDAESIPPTPMPVSLMLLEATHQVGGKSDIVEPVTLVERVDAVVATDHLADHLGIGVEDLAGDGLEMGGYEMFAGSHRDRPQMLVRDPLRMSRSSTCGRELLVHGRHRGLVEAKLPTEGPASLEVVAGIAYRPKVLPRLAEELAQKLIRPEGSPYKLVPRVVLHPNVDEGKQSHIRLVGWNPEHQVADAAILATSLVCGFSILLEQLHGGQLLVTNRGDVDILDVLHLRLAILLILDQCEGAVPILRLHLALVDLHTGARLDRVAAFVVTQGPVLKRARPDDGRQGAYATLLGCILGGSGRWCERAQDGDEQRDESFHHGLVPHLQYGPGTANRDLNLAGRSGQRVTRPSNGGGGQTKHLSAETTPCGATHAAVPPVGRSLSISTHEGTVVPGGRLRGHGDRNGQAYPRKPALAEAGGRGGGRGEVRGKG